MVVKQIIPPVQIAKIDINGVGVELAQGWEMWDTTNREEGNLPN